MWSKGISYFKTLTRGMSESESVVENPDPPVGEEEGELGENDFNELPGEGEGIETGETNEEFGVLPSNPVDEVQGPPVDPNKVLELGDRILIVQEGDKISVGTVYYRTGTLLRLKTDGDNTKLIDFGIWFSPLNIEENLYES